MSDKPKRHVFGPVPSRRLGLSLGVDLVPVKTCSFDCVYCQAGPTTNLTAERKQYVPVDEVIRELEERLKAGPAPDVITLSGSGEPTLHAGFGEVIGAIKSMTAAPVAVLTNGSLLSLAEVRKALSAADIVVPNLDAGTPETFQRVCRPAAGIDFNEVVEGLLAFGREFRGEFMQEVFLLDGINDSESEVANIARIAAKAAPGKVQLNTVTRPPAEDFAGRVSGARLEALAMRFDPPAEVIAGFSGSDDVPFRSGTTAEEVLALLSRRPCTLADIRRGLSAPKGQAASLVESLLARGLIESVSRGGEIYYSIQGRSE